MTIGFDNKNGYWKSTYSYNTMCFASMNKRFLSFRDVRSDESPSEQTICYAHTENSGLNTFFENAGQNSIIAVSFNDNVSQNKIYKSLSIEGSRISEALNSINFFRANSDNNPDKVTPSGGRLREKGGVMYGHIGSIATDTNTNISIVGPVESIESSSIANTLRVIVNGADYSNVTSNSRFFFVSNDGEIWSKGDHNAMQYYGVIGETENWTMEYDWIEDNTNLRVYIQGDNNDYFSGSSIIINNFSQSVYDNSSGNFTEAVEDGEMMLFCATDTAVNGEQPKGQYSEAWFVMPPNNGFEVNAINLNYETVSADHSK